MAWQAQQQCCQMQQLLQTSVITSPILKSLWQNFPQILSCCTPKFELWGAEQNLISAWHEICCMLQQCYNVAKRIYTTQTCLCTVENCTHPLQNKTLLTKSLLCWENKPAYQKPTHTQTTTWLPATCCNLMHLWSLRPLSCAIWAPARVGSDLVQGQGVHLSSGLADSHAAPQGGPTDTYTHQY